MSSIIVLDSSDEDESPAKKPNLQSLPSSGDTANSSNCKSIKSKERNLSSFITITPHNSHGTHITKLQSSSSMEDSHTPNVLATNVNHAINNLINNERQTPTPPKSTQRKQKLTSAPTSHQFASKSFANMGATNIMSPAAAATTLAPLPPIMPMITGVHSMAVAGATPPLQLMATPPHALGNMASNLSDQALINHGLLQPNLPPNTTITAHPSPNPNKNNINNNFKIHLPPKPLTPSPSASPTSSTKPTSPQFATANYKVGRQEKPPKRVRPTTILKPTDDAWLQQRPKVSMKPEDPYQSSQHFANNEVMWEGGPVSPASSKSSSQQQTPVASPSLPRIRKSPDVIKFTSKASAIFDLTTSPDKFSHTSMSSDETPIIHHPNRSFRNQLNGESGKGLLTGENDKPTASPKNEQKTESPKPPLEPEFEELIEVCRKADPSVDMNKLIKTKLIKYYYEVHGDFVKSKSFRKSLRKVVAAIRSEPDLVYYNLTTVVEELKIRRKAKVTDALSTEINSSVDASIEVKEEQVPSIDKKLPQTSIGPEPATSTTTLPISSTGNKKLDEQIKKLNKALYVLTKRIDVLEQSEVDWDDDDSSFLQVERFKKRACQIYEKICDLTGESKNARRLVKKPIRFNETRIPQFNKTLQAFINRTKEFPDYFDVLRMLEHCNRTYGLGLVNFEIKNIAEDAFIKVGKLLQSRRKADLYETVIHYGREKDPAQSDPILAAKLSENQKNCRKIEDILEKFARKQETPDEEDDEDNKAENTKLSEKDMKCSQIGDLEDGSNCNKTNTDTKDNVKPVTVNITNDNLKEQSDNKLEDGESDDDDDDDDDEDADLEEHVETLANGDDTDNESENENSNRDENGKFSSANEAQTKQNHIDDSMVTETNANDVPCCTISHREIVDCAENNGTLAQTVTINNNIKKTVLIHTAKECNTPPPNGKYKESELHKLSSSPVVSLPLLSVTKTTTTTKADVKIVTVSSQSVGGIRSPKSTSTLFQESTSKTFEEIVISDEES